MSLCNLFSSRDSISHLSLLHLHISFPELVAGLTGEYALVWYILHDSASLCVVGNKAVPPPPCQINARKLPPLSWRCTLQMSPSHSVAPCVSLPVFLFLVSNLPRSTERANRIDTIDSPTSTPSVPWSVSYPYTSI